MKRCTDSKKMQSVPFAAIAMMLLPLIGNAQIVVGSDDPQVVVQNFKASLDDDNISGMCAVMAETDRSGPLSRLHYETMQGSMSELVKMWRYVSFTFGQVEIHNEKTPNWALVHISADQLKQEITFTVLKFGSGWYICDVEIYFR